MMIFSRRTYAASLSTISIAVCTRASTGTCPLVPSSAQPATATRVQIIFANRTQSEVAVARRNTAVDLCTF